MNTGEGYLAIARSKQQKRADLIPAKWQIDSKQDFTGSVLDIPKSCGILNARELEITGCHDALEIVRKVANRTYTAVEVTTAFCKRAAIAQQLVNCLSEIMFDAALKRAQCLDQEQRENPDKPLRPLHGLPISIKDSFRVPGYDSTIGYIAFANQPDTDASALVRLLLDQGAVLYCKTNVAQSLMSADSNNNVFGRTLNPHRSNLTAGGSSGGEGALIALRGSVLGVGTDLAGSIRIPAVCCGTYGFRPSVALTPHGGTKDPTPPGKSGIVSVVGPLATSLRACDFFTKVVVNSQPWRYDLECRHCPAWRKFGGRTQNVRIGLVSSDGIKTPWPPVRRALREVATKLRNSGLNVTELKLPDAMEAVRVAFGLYALDVGEYTRETLKRGGEPLTESFKRVWGTEMPPQPNLQEYFALRHARKRVQETFQKFWLDNKLDVILMPPAPTTATALDSWHGSAYQALWNLLDYPAISLPTGKVENTDVPDSIENAVLGDHDRFSYKLYTGPSDFLGAPLAVQLIGMHQEDEKLMEIAEELDNVLRT